jgi:hypothetical protein
MATTTPSLASVDQFIDRFSGLSEEYKFYGGTVTLQYEPKSHTYFLVLPDGELEAQQGVTSVCHIIDKSKFLIPWGCKMMAAKLLASIPTKVLMADPNVPGGVIVPSMDFADFEHLVLDAKNAHTERLEEAAELGSIAHNWIERYIKSVLDGGVDSNVTQEILANFPFDERIKNCCLAALDWMRRHNVRWVSTERKIYSRKHKYAGTADGFAYIDSCDDPTCCPVPFKDRYSNVDWKSSNQLYIEYILQGAAYTEAYNEELLAEFHTALRETPPLITDRWVIRLGKEDANFDPWHCEEGTFEQDFGAFLQALALKNSIEAIEKRMDAYKAARREAKKQLKKAAKVKATAEEKAKRAADKAAAKEAAKEALKIKCKGADRYQGVRRPTCNGGKGCETCLKIYQDAQAAKSHARKTETTSLLGLLK